MRDYLICLHNFMSVDINSSCYSVATCCDRIAVILKMTVSIKMFGLRMTVIWPIHVAIE